MVVAHFYPQGQDRTCGNVQDLWSSWAVVRGAGDSPRLPRCGRVQLRSTALRPAGRTSTGRMTAVGWATAPRTISPPCGCEGLGPAHPRQSHHVRRRRPDARVAPGVPARARDGTSAGRRAHVSRGTIRVTSTDGLLPSAWRAPGSDRRGAESSMARLEEALVHAGTGSAGGRGSLTGESTWTPASRAGPEDAGTGVPCATAGGPPSHGSPGPPAGLAPSACPTQAPYLATACPRPPPRTPADPQEP